MQTFTNLSDVKNYVQEALATSEGYPEAYKIDEIAQKISRWDHDKQAVVLTVGEGEFWEIVKAGTYYDLEALKWENAPKGWGIAYGKTATLLAGEDDYDEPQVIVDYDIDGTDEARLTVATSLSSVKSRTDWASSARTRDWPVLDDLFGRKQWQTWLADKTEEMQARDSENLDED
jgi:hypothetical protein